MPKRNKNKKKNPIQETPERQTVPRRELTPITRGNFAALFGDLLENPDITLEKNSPDNIEIYSTMWRLDDQLSSSMAKLAENMTSLGYSITPGDEGPKFVERADFITDVFNGVQNFTQARSGFCRGISHGYAPAEIMYKTMANGRIGIQEFKCREPERFRFNEKYQLVFVGETTVEAVPMPAYKFIVNTWGCSDTPYGRGMFQDCYANWYFKSNTKKRFFEFVEKIGMPWILGWYPIGTQQGEQDNFYQNLVNMISNGVAIGPEGSQVEIKDTGNMNAAQLWKEIVDYIDKQFAKLILGQTLSTESESGTFALAKFQSKGEQRRTESISQWQEEQMNQVIVFLEDWNFGPAPDGKYSRFKIAFEENADIEAIGKALGAIVNIGFPVTLKTASEMTRLPIPEGYDEDEILEVKQQSFPGPGGSPFDKEPEKDEEKESGLSDTGETVTFAEGKKKVVQR